MELLRQSDQNSPLPLSLLNNLFPIDELFVESQISHAILKDFFYSEHSLGPTQNTTISFKVSDEEGFYLIYCWQGEVLISLQNGNSRVIKPFQSALIFDGKGTGFKMALEKCESYQFSIIGFNNPLLFQNSCYKKCKETFLRNIPENRRIYIGRPYLKLLEKINSLSRMARNDIASELIMEGLIYQIFGLKMQQFIEAINGNHGDMGTLTREEMERVQSISDFIRQNPSLVYTVQYLCRETGLSPSKLQEGFKRMHERTVIDFIRNVRLEKSVELIKTTDLNISEIVYSIGLTSRSYFSKIFKNKYKCSPKFYQEQKRMERMRV